ncbi:uncharacterized protein LOC133790222 [Humulus lupulus]|uniref:uncharacterized protein LOC133790222 n=1 Tax=Humulus lupulus TaxID=3486 RepID=UPI002B40D93B|nr:uncharacterized protein LOC133790222 [Humulus lupulus]
MSLGGHERGKSRGWAAFDRHQRQKQGLLPLNHDPDSDRDPFPSLPSSSSSSFSINTSGSGGGAVPKLKQLHSWADHTLIQDIMEAVDHDFQRASTLLQAMDVSSSAHDRETDQNRNPIMELRLEEEASPSGEQLSEDNKNPPTPIMEGRFSYVPMEPEWEEGYDDEDGDSDGVYLRHRKEALRAMRSASQHAKAATNAFLKGNHSSAHQHSLKAQQQRLAAEALNAKAANDILTVRNSQNDVWNLDLHGLHASEAVQALRQRLHRIETQLLSNRSLSPNSLDMDTRMRRRRTVSSSSLESMENKNREQTSLRGQRPTSLHVITGVGNHSRGQASLPAAVTGFLNENGYHYEELKPGVITVRPKFRLLS